jgi:hypothetical protein
MWVTEVSFPFHHGLVKRWHLVIVDALGHRLAGGDGFLTEEEAQREANHWQDTHPEIQVHRATTIGKV